MTLFCIIPKKIVIIYRGKFELFYVSVDWKIKKEDILKLQHVFVVHQTLLFQKIMGKSICHDMTSLKTYCTNPIRTSCTELREKRTLKWREQSSKKNHTEKQNVLLKCEYILRETPSITEPLNWPSPHRLDRWQDIWNRISLSVILSNDSSSQSHD